MLASALTLRGQAGEARLGYLKALQLDPSDATNMAMANLSVLEAEVLGRHDEALSLGETVAPPRSQPRSCVLHVGLPLLFLREDDLTEHWLNAAQSRFPDTKRIQLLESCWSTCAATTLLPWRLPVRPSLLIQVGRSSQLSWLSYPF